MDALLAYLFAPLGIGLCLLLLLMGGVSGLITWWRGKGKKD